MSVEMKIDIFERLEKLFQNHACKWFVPNGVMEELKLLGKKFSETLELASKCRLVKDNFDVDSCSASEAILQLIGEANTNKYIVCTQDTDLRRSLRSIPGVPLVYLNRSVLVFENPSIASKNTDRKIEKSKLKNFNSVEQKLLKNAVKPIKSYAKEKQPKVKVAKGKNPLSCKKKTMKKPRVKKNKAEKDL